VARTAHAANYKLCGREPTLPGDTGALYVSLDDIWFSEYRLVELADAFIKRGGRYLFLDEVHKYPDWSREIKNIYDDKFKITPSLSARVCTKCSRFGQGPLFAVATIAVAAVRDVPQKVAAFAGLCGGFTQCARSSPTASSASANMWGSSGAGCPGFHRRAYE